jgi:hypothetical protein
VGFSVEDSYAIDNRDIPTFMPPQPLTDYMNTGLWWIRDSNWSPDFPTSARVAQNMYKYFREIEVDGVIAIDQQSIQILLTALGPIEVEFEGGTYEIGAENVIDFMRFSRNLEEGESVNAEWFRTRKDFMRPLASTLLTKLQSGSDLDWGAVARAMIRALDEKHVLVWLDHEALAAVIANQGWDGALQPGEGDFLAVVDSNFGFNKVDAVMDISLRYELDLSDLSYPAATLTVTHYNPGIGLDPVDCDHRPDYGDGSYEAMVHRCYWDYLRFYTRIESQLLEATPHHVPAEWMILERTVPAQVDDLSTMPLRPERFENLRAFGTMLVVPVGEALETSFQLALPADVVFEQDEQGNIRYSLRVVKQPGTIGDNLEIRILLPEGAEVLFSSQGGEFSRGVWQLEIDLVVDFELELLFNAP